MYGLTLLVAIVACIWLTGRRWVAQGGDWDLVMRVAVWGVAFGVVGARAYHDITSWNEVPSPKWKGIFEVWQGGLGIWGGILLGTLVGAYIIHRAGTASASSWTAPRRGCCSPRESAASATGGTRSCTARRRRCRGA
jgi:Prolipoprotein diacylglyceryltransferase